MMSCAGPGRRAPNRNLFTSMDASGVQAHSLSQDVDAVVYNAGMVTCPSCYSTACASAQ